MRGREDGHGNHDRNSGTVALGIRLWMWDMDFDGREKNNPQNGHMRVRPIFMHSNKMV